MDAHSANLLHILQEQANQLNRRLDSAAELYDNFYQQADIYFQAGDMARAQKALQNALSLTISGSIDFQAIRCLIGIVDGSHASRSTGQSGAQGRARCLSDLLWLTSDETTANQESMQNAKSPQSLYALEYTDNSHSKIQLKQGKSSEQTRIACVTVGIQQGHAVDMTFSCQISIVYMCTASALSNKNLQHKRLLMYLHLSKMADFLVIAKEISINYSQQAFINHVNDVEIVIRPNLFQEQASKYCKHHSKPHNSPQAFANTLSAAINPQKSAENATALKSPGTKVLSSYCPGENTVQNSNIIAFVNCLFLPNFGLNCECGIALEESSYTDLLFRLFRNAYPSFLSYFKSIMRIWENKNVYQSMSFEDAIREIEGEKNKMAQANWIIEEIERFKETVLIYYIKKIDLIYLEHARAYYNTVYKSLDYQLKAELPGLLMVNCSVPIDGKQKDTSLIETNGAVQSRSRTKSSKTHDKEENQWQIGRKEGRSDWREAIKKEVYETITVWGLWRLRMVYHTYYTKLIPARCTHISVSVSRS